MAGPLSPRPTTGYFLATLPGWPYDLEINEIVPEEPVRQQAAGTGSLTLKVHMNKGFTKDAQATIPPALPGSQKGGKTGDPRLYIAAVVGETPFDQQISL